jgi:hypothetical protein
MLISIDMLNNRWQKVSFKGLNSIETFEVIGIESISTHEILVAESSDLYPYFPGFGLSKLQLQANLTCT